MIKDLAILFGIPAVVYFLVSLTGRPRAPMIAGGITLLALLAIFVPNFLAARERIAAVRGAFLELRTAVEEKSPGAMEMLVQSERQGLEEAASALGGRVTAQRLFDFIAPRELPHEEISVRLEGPDRAVVQITWRERGSMGFVQGDRFEEFQSVQEDGQWKFALGTARLRQAAQAFARPEE